MHRERARVITIVDDERMFYARHELRPRRRRPIIRKRFGNSNEIHAENQPERGGGAGGIGMHAPQYAVDPHGYKTAAVLDLERYPRSGNAIAAIRRHNAVFKPRDPQVRALRKTVRHHARTG